MLPVILHHRPPLHRLRRALVLLLLVALQLSIHLLSSVAEATETEQDARVLYQKGNAAFKSGDDIVARDYYARSLALSESFDTLCNLGRAEARGALWADAYRHLGLCLKLYPQDAELAFAKQKFAELRDDVRTHLSDQEAADIDAEVASHTSAQEKAEEPEQPEQPVAASEPEPEKQPAHVTAVEDQGTQYQAGRLPTVITLASLGVVAGGVSAGLFVSYKNKRSDAFALRDRMLDAGITCPAGASSPQCSTLQDELNSAKKTRTWGYISGGAGAALLVSATVLYFVWPKASDTSGATLKSPETARKRMPLIVPEVAQTSIGSWTFGLHGAF